MESENNDAYLRFTSDT